MTPEERESILHKIQTADLSELIDILESIYDPVAILKNSHFNYDDWSVMVGHEVTHGDNLVDVIKTMLLARIDKLAFRPNPKLICFPLTPTEDVITAECTYPANHHET